MKDLLNRIVRMAAGRSDIVVASFLLLVVVMMIIPIPLFLVDVMVSFSIAFTVLVLIVAFYSSRAADFSALPPIILLSTLFRLSLSITTTRLILRDADAGEIVAAFGEYVIAGDVVVGLVIFLIITAAQFIVITKGAERVAEVGARFSLDAMPGKQMSIDADLRNGDINKDEAKLRRQSLERESQLFGAMDGAMKFVKGDAIASLIILCVNLMGGIIIGTVRHGLSFSDAVHTYSLLSVGDGLIAQLPALMTAVAAGIVVTRVNSGQNVDLGAEIIGQLGAQSKVMALCAGVLVLLSLVPGFPMHTFLGIAVLLGGAAYMARRREDAAVEVDSDEAAEEGQGDVGAVQVSAVHMLSDWVDPPSGRVTLRVGPELATALGLQPVQLALEDARIRAEIALGIPFQPIGFKLDDLLPDPLFSVYLDGVPVAGGAVHPGCVFARGNLPMLEVLGVEPRETVSIEGQPAVWIPHQYTQEIEKLGGVCLTPEEALAEYLLAIQLQHAPEFLGIQETRQLLGELEQSFPELVRQATQAVPLQRMAEIFRRLLEERVCIGNLRAVLEVLARTGEGNSLPAQVESIRAALSRHICHQYADVHRTIAVYVFSRDLEQEIRRELSSKEGRGGMLSAGLSSRLIEGLQAVPSVAGRTSRAVLMIAADMRRYMYHHLSRHGVNIPVMSYTELANGYVSHPLGMLGLNGRLEALGTPSPNEADKAAA